MPRSMVLIHQNEERLRAPGPLSESRSRPWEEGNRGRRFGVTLSVTTATRWLAPLLHLTWSKGLNQLKSTDAPAWSKHGGRTPERP